MDRISFWLVVVFVSAAQLSTAVFGAGPTLEELQAKATSTGVVSYSDRSVSKSFDLSAVELGKQHFFQFVVENTSTRSLRLTETKTSCGCLAAIPAKRVISSGEKTSIFLVFKASEPGPFNRTVELNLAENLDKIEVRVKGIAQHPFRMVPEVLDLEGGTDVKCKIIPRFDNTIDIKTVYANSSIVEVTDQRNLKNGIEIRLNVDDPKGRVVHSGVGVELLLQTMHGEVVFPVHITDSRRFKVFPKTLFGKKGDSGNYQFVTSVYGASSRIEELLSVTDWKLVMRSSDDDEKVVGDPGEVVVTRTSEKAARLVLEIDPELLRKSSDSNEVTVSVGAGEQSFFEVSVVRSRR